MCHIFIQVLTTKKGEPETSPSTTPKSRTKF